MKLSLLNDAFVADLVQQIILQFAELVLLGLVQGPDSLIATEND